MGSFWEALLGARQAWKKRKGTREKLCFAVHVVRLVASELLSTAKLAPYATRAWLDARPALDRFRGRQASNLRVLKGLVYAKESPEQRMDVYIPCSSVKETDQSFQSDVKPPAVLFVHGGTWSTGSAWHYAPMARRLAEEGILVAVADYRLYPRASMDEIVHDVHEAMRWTLEHAPSLGADPNRVTVVGHSAGAHLVAKALLQDTRKTKDTSDDQSKRLQPSLFVGIAGVYDIQKHYEYEAGRNVHELSTMERAMGGVENFRVHSPSLLVQDIVTERERSKKNPTSLQGSMRGNIAPARKQMLFGEDIPARMGLSESNHWKYMNVSQEPLLNFPSTVLAGSLKDVVVPWYHSAEFAFHLTRAGIPVKQLVYDNVGHGDFVIDWWSSHVQEDLPQHSKDLLLLLKNGLL